MSLTLPKLPTEILDLVLQNLHITDLLSFARTSKTNHELSIQALTYLDLAVFPRRIHSLLAFFDAVSDEDEGDYQESSEDPPIFTKFWSRPSANDKSLHQIGLITPNSNRPSLSRSNTPPTTTTLSGRDRKALHYSSSKSVPSTTPPPTPLSLRTTEISSQNTTASTVLSTPALKNLRSLTLRLYDLTSPALAAALATGFPDLHTLNLEFSHPYIHDTTLPAKFWKDTVPTGSPIWNILSGTGNANSTALKLRNLKSLRLNRCGITSFQLRHWIESNPDLYELRLSLCRGVDTEFVTWLASYITSGRSKLQTIRLIDCGLLELRSMPQLTWITDIAATGTLHELSLRGCKNVSEEIFHQIACPSEEPNYTYGPWSKIQKLVSPRGVVLQRRQPHRPSRSTPSSNRVDEDIVHSSRLGSVSPALTISDGMLGSISGPIGETGYFGKIEVDPALQF